MLNALQSLLILTLGVEHTVQWEALKDNSDYPVAKPTKAEPPPEPDRPATCLKPEPHFLAYRPKLGLLGLFLKSVRDRRKTAAREKYLHDLKKWYEGCKEDVAEFYDLANQYNARLRGNSAQYCRALESWGAGPQSPATAGMSPSPPLVLLLPSSYRPWIKERELAGSARSHHDQISIQLRLP
jgi:hypothetical protein